MEKEKVKFVHNNMQENGERLARHFGLAKIENVPVVDFMININGKQEANTVRVKSNWYRVALLMLYLVEEQGDKFFEITPQKRETVRNFFGPDICRIAYKDKNSFPMVRLLLEEGAEVSVSLKTHPDGYWSRLKNLLSWH